jgi:hypothetical protein
MNLFKVFLLSFIDGKYINEQFFYIWDKAITQSNNA